MLPQPVPTSRVAFSSRVIACRTSSMLFLFSLGCAEAARAARVAANRRVILFIVFELWFSCCKITKESRICQRSGDI